MTPASMSGSDRPYSRNRWHVGVLLTLGTLSGCFQSVSAAPSVGPVVVELFTSQGCSSCPPADALLGEFAKQDNVIALAYHVDYWDDLGWRDLFSIPEAMRRQSSYARRLSGAGAFTPQGVVNGRSSFVGSDRRAMKTAVSSAQSMIPVRLSLLDGTLVIELNANDAGRSYDIDAVSFLPEAVTPIGRGENARRTLREFNIVRSFERVSVWNGTVERIAVPLSSFPNDASNVAVLVQEQHEGTILGASSISLGGSGR